MSRTSRNVRGKDKRRMDGVWRAMVARAVVAGAGAGVLALSLASCTSGTSSDAEPEIDQIPVVQDAGELTLPLDAYNFTSDSQRVFEDAKATLVRDCLRRFGVEVSMSDIREDDLPEYGWQRERRYGLFDMAAAQSRGYHRQGMPSEPQTFSSLDEIEEYRRAQGRWFPSEAEQFLLDGHGRSEFEGRDLPRDANGEPLPDEGCRGEAEQVLYDGLSRPARPIDAAAQSKQRAFGDSRVEEAKAAWSDCMADRGYDYSSIWEPSNRDWPDPVTDEEIATAVADVECKRETNLVGIWYAVDAAHQRAFIENNAERLAELETWLETVHENATRVLNEA